MDPNFYPINHFAWALQGRGVVVLGEVHDNGAHHAFRAHLIEGLMRNPPRQLLGTSGPLGEPLPPSIIFEQAKSDQQTGLDRFALLQPPNRTLSEWKRLVNWDKSGWAKYDYDPLLRTITGAGLTMFAGDVLRAAIMKAAKEGPSALSPETSTRLALDTPLGPAQDAALLAEIEEAHCGAMPKEMLPGMASAQRYRDAHLADVTLNAAAAHGSAILLAGNGHARTDRGVPWYIRQRAPGRKVVSVMLIEVEEGRTDPEAYVPRDPDGRPATDYIVFTPPASRPDPCAQFLDKKH